ncbi:MAG TPA: DUF4169 family protein [Candidatus Cybelea sp.]|nr:DUF4169 family protein [Candidatus Cybelea sp.]
MGDVVNFNQYRKERARLDNKRRANENRIRHGLSKSERALPRRDRERAENDLEGKRLDPPPGTDENAKGE